MEVAGRWNKIRGEGRRVGGRKGSLVGPGTELGLKGGELEA
jgi:hypothetical protein